MDLRSVPTLIFKRFTDFTEAAGACWEEVMRQLVDPTTFHANLPDIGEVDFDGFLAELRRQHRAFPDLGSNVVVHRTLEGPTEVVVHYSMTITHLGPLVNKLGHELPPTGNSVTLKSTDWYVFNAEGLITEIVIARDFMEIFNQLMRRS